MNAEPAVSVVTPSYNQAQFLGQTIASVLAQDYPRLEYLVLDGGSTDGSVDVIRQYEDRIEYWISEPDAGQADAINRGWKRSRGEILAWLNSDDVYEAGAISAAVEAFQRHPGVDVVTGDCQVIDEAGRFVKRLPSGEFNIQAILSGNSLPQQGVFCRRQAVEAAGWLDTNLNYVFDWALWLRLGLRGARFHHLPRVLASFRVWGQSKTTSGTVGASLSGGLPFAQERFGVLSALVQESWILQDPDAGAQLQQALRGSMLELALLHLVAGQQDEARAYLTRFSQDISVPLDSLPHPQALAAHLAYLDGEIAVSLETFIEALSATREQMGFTSQTRQWERQLRAETYLVQAWNATHFADIRCAAKCFVKAILADPVLIRQRRVLSPAARYLLASLLAGPARSHRREGPSQGLS